MSDTHSSPPDITCHATKWYLWRRVVPFAILPLLLSVYFFYDWKVGYPDKLKQYETFQRYKAENKIEEWPKFAASQGWSSQEPEKMDQRKIDEQFHWGVGVGILGAVCLVYYLLSYPKKLTADATSFTPPWGRPIPFASVHRIDKRPWKLKGLAKIYYKNSETTKKTVIDDLRFAGADKILARLEANFSGEIVDHEEIPSETTAEAPATKEESS